MNTTALLVAVLTLAAGAVIGVLYGRFRGDSAARDAVAEAEAAGRAAVAAAQAETRQVSEELARMEATLDSERAAAQDRHESEAAAEKRLQQMFGALAGEALNRNNEAFAALAEAKLATVKSSADGELAQRQQAIEGMVGPLRESLEKVQQQLNSVEKARAGSYSALLEQIGTMRQTSEQLRLETTQLVTALRAPQVRGRWGEMQLERAVEAAGMTEHIDYVTQATVAGPDGKLRPDMVVQLVGGKSVVVDSKVAFAGYLEAMEARDESTRAARLRAHARHLRTHIDALGDKSYYEHFSPSPEFVVCFVPADAFLDAALREDPALLEHAFDRNVVVATPSTLVALLRTVAYTWRQEALAANAAEVHKLGRELYQRLSTMGGHIDKLGRSLNSAVGSYNQTVSSLESRVLVSARKMIDLKVVEPGDAITAPAQVTETARSTQAPEVTEQRVVALPKHRVPQGQGELLPSAPEPEHRQTS
ncbi:MAG TPA: DNA recombination protein RmuC [Jatrophihabitans sp.]|uniref:DNA recombination protein RmuC n=1 Tax=Jatrophihabitans sp. TaxID=1932789 RepID=UPI002DFA47E4|nr:DNA recombination protein RmuC [Jatrophihabitans sp.]